MVNENAANRSVLVVDDDAALRTLFQTLLRRHDFKVECVNDGSQALARLEQHSYAAVLLDLMMPVTNGYDVLLRLKATNPSLLRRTIVTTGVSERDLAKIDSASVYAVLRKPFDINELVTTIRRCAAAAEDAEDEAKLDASISRLEAELPELKELLSSPTLCESELVLRSQLRQTIETLAGVISVAGTASEDPKRRTRYTNAGLRALNVALTSAPPRLEH